MPRRILNAGVIAVVFAVSVPVFAQTGAAKKPADATAQCTDGTYSTAKTEKGACTKHGGVKTWFGAPAAAAKEPSPKGPEPKKGAAPATGAASNKAAATKEPTRKNDTAKNAGPAPAGSTGQCSDGSYTRAKTQSGACSNHGGVQTWFATNAPATAAPPASSTPAAAPRNTPPPPSPTPAPSRTPAAQPQPPAPAAAAPSAQRAPAAPAKASGKAQIVAPPPGTPENAIAKCKDATYSFAKAHTGACSNHGGVAEWYR